MAEVPAAGGGLGFDPVSMGLSALQTGIGLYNQFKGQAEMKKLQDQRTTYKTPDEIFKMANLTFNNAGGDTKARDYKQNQLDQSFAEILGTATRLGADPNQLSALLDRKISGSLQIGEQFHASNMKAFDNVLNAYETLAAHETMEWRSKDDMLKDRIQAAAAKAKAGAANVSGGVNNAISTLSSGRIEELYKDLIKKTGTNPIVAGSKLSNGFAMGIDPTTGLAANDAASRQTTGLR